MNIIKTLRYIKHVYMFNLREALLACSRNSQEIALMRNINKGKRCFVIATGPSLTVKDIELIKNEDTIAVNSIFLMFDKTDWRPKYYVCTDSSYFKRLVDSYGISSTGLCREDLFLNRENRKINSDFGKNKKIKWIDFSPWNRIYNFENYQFNDDIAKGMYAFGTVTNIAIAIAMYLGYKEIYLIGADCSNLNQHFINDITDADKDEQYVNHLICMQLMGYKIMRKESEKRNVKVFNATRGGALEEFDRVDFDKIIGLGKGQEGQAPNKI